MDSVRRRWREVMARKRRGALTDAALIDAVEKFITDKMRLHGVKFRLEVTEAKERDVFHLSQYWTIRADYEGNPRYMSNTKWEKLRIDDELETLEAGIDREKCQSAEPSATRTTRRTTTKRTGQTIRRSVGRRPELSLVVLAGEPVVMARAARAQTPQWLGCGRLEPLAQC